MSFQQIYLIIRCCVDTLVSIPKQPTSEAAPKGGCPQSIHFKNSFKLHLVKNRFDWDLVLPCVGRASQEGVVILAVEAPTACELLVAVTAGAGWLQDLPATNSAFLEDFAPVMGALTYKCCHSVPAASSVSVV